MLKFRLHSDTDMTSGSIYAHILKFSLPMMVGMLFQQLYNTVDTIVVGQFVGDSALAAVGTTGSVTNMLVGVCTGLSAGAGVVISQRYGAHDDKRLSDAVHTAVVLSFLLGLAATLIGIAIVRPMLTLIKMPEDVLPDGKLYLTIYFAGISSLLVYNMGSGILRAVGDSRRPLIFLIVSALVNTVGDLVLVVFFDLGVAGVALATIFAEFVSAVLVLTVLTRSKGNYALSWDRLRIESDTLKSILRIGLPSSIQQGITSFSNVFVQSYINVFGKSVMAGWTSYSKIDGFIMLPLQAIALASTTFVGQNFGAKNYKRARQGTSACLRLALLVTAILIAFVMIVKRPLLHIVTPDERIIEYGALFISLISPFYLMVCFNQVHAGALRGIGSTKVPMLVMLGSFVAFRQVYLFVNRLITADMTFELFGYPISLVTTALGYPVGWILCSILITIFYHHSFLFKVEEKD